jgi:histidine triad (HIT) family protein
VAGDCLFCKIAAREIHADIVAESAGVLAFRDVAPQAPTHVLVIPKRHIASVRELAPGDGSMVAEMFELMARVARDEGLERGYRIVTNIGPDGGQTVDHLHFHVLGGRAMTWPPG